MTTHMEEQQAQETPSKPKNRRNGHSKKTIKGEFGEDGHSKKTIKGEFGEAEIEIPRDRTSAFEPQLIRKGQTRFDGFDDKILSASFAFVQFVRTNLRDRSIPPITPLSQPGHYSVYTHKPGHS